MTVSFRNSVGARWNKSEAATWETNDTRQTTERWSDVRSEATRLHRLGVVGRFRRENRGEAG